ncbi:MAG: hypothetical protein HYT80_00310 [Euryarchaeota archaeon]|nr:hypothetical protein [Euryarchaeota archaeon]
MEPEHETAPKMPVWVKVFIAIGAALAVVAVAAVLVGGEHGPGRHLGGGDAAPADLPSEMQPEPTRLDAGHATPHSTDGRR